MSRQLAALDRKDAATTAPARPARQSRLSKGELAFLLAVPTIAGALYVLVHAFPSLLGKHPWQTGTSPVRPPSQAATGPFSFEASTPSGRPVSYSHCRPIHYVVNPAGMPKQGRQMIHEAVQAISDASRLKFVDDGLTNEPPAKDRPPSPSSYSHHWYPLLIAWADHSQYPDIEKDIEGIGGSTGISLHGPESEQYVSGQIVLSRDGIAKMLTGRDGYVEARAIIEHELGHVVGLGHVKNPQELMNPEYTGQPGLAAGDRQGLALLGSGPCLPD